MYLRDKNGRVAQPDPTQLDKGVIFASGMVEIKEGGFDKLFNTCTRYLLNMNGYITLHSLATSGF